MLLSPAGLIPVRAAPGTPTLVGPADYATLTVNEAPPMAIPTFQWDSVPGATKYRLQVSAGSAFSTFVLDVTTSNTSFTPYSASSINKFSDGDFIWHVKVESPAGGAYSNAWHFTKQWASVANKPQLSSPADFATLDFYDAPSFSWTPVTGAVRYEVQFYSSPGGWSSLDTPLVSTLATTYQPKDKLLDGIHYWRVVPIDAGGHDGTPSDERQFTANYSPTLTLLDPDPDTTTYPALTPTFRWTAVRGAEYYQLQYATDGAFTANLVTAPNLRNTQYTPLTTLPNDQNYWWRVRAISGNSVTDWVESTAPFQKRWYIKPVLLTPTNSYPDVSFPFFSWTPVPGAAYYILDIDQDSTFTNPLYLTSEKTSNTFYTPQKYTGISDDFFWRVTPYDGNDKKGSSSITFNYHSYYSSVAPDLVYPLYYYPPDVFAGFPDIHMNPYEDRTVAMPIFTWHRVLNPADDLDEGDEYAEQYELQVSTDTTFTAVNWGDTIHNWKIVTENTTAAPSAAHPFSPVSGTNYFWRVRCLVDGLPVGPWSQVWKTRFNPSLKLPATGGAAPQLLRPTNGYEYIEATPLLEWFPKTGATTYDVQISRDTGFTEIVDTGTVSNPSYMPTESLGRRSLGDTDFYVYYWRVKQTGGSWSETRRFQVAAQVRWNLTHPLGEMVNPSRIATDPSGDMSLANASYDVTDLYAVQTRDYWHYGFHIAPSQTLDVVYGLYIDMDGYVGSGGTSDPRGYSMTAVPAHLPEYAMYVEEIAGAFSAANVYIYHWQGAAWGPAQTLQSLGGSLSKFGTYVEIKGPNSAIGYNPVGFSPHLPSYFIAMVSLKADHTGNAIDTVPTGTAQPLTAFAQVLLRNPYQVGSDPAVGEGDVTTDPDYDITDLYVSDSGTDWYFGFHVPDGPGKDVTYAIYLDMDHVEGSGGTTDPRGYTLSTISAYRPEYVIYVLQQSGTFSPYFVYFYHWEGTDWGPGFSLDTIGGQISHNDFNDYVEFSISNTSIGYDVTTGSYTMAFVSLPSGNTGSPQDSVPSDPNVPGSGPLSRFTSVSERINMLQPPSNLGVDPTTYPSILPMWWDNPVLTPFSGFLVTVYRDPGYTTEVGSYNFKVTDSSYWAQAVQFWPKDFVGDTTYYWRVKPNYLPGAAAGGVWSQGSRMERVGFKPQNLRASVTFATPTFSWDLVEGALSYDLQVATDAGFGALVVDVLQTKLNSYTPNNTLANGTYYWHVRARRYGSVINEWTAPQSFTLSLPGPTGLSHSPSGIVGRAPTFCWTPLVINAPVGDPFAGTPFFAAWKYRVLVSEDPNFSTNYESVDTEQSCWTPTKGYKDRDTFYWKVAAIDGNGRLGNYSATQTFGKQYPVTTLVSPANGSNLGSTPTYTWTPVNGAMYYKLDVAHDANFSGIFDTVTTPNTSYTPTFVYSQVIPDIYWRVAIIDYNGNMGPYNNATLILDPYPFNIFLPLAIR